MDRRDFLRLGAAGVTDVLPSFCELAGVPLPKDRTIDGASLVPLMHDGSPQRRTPLFWFFYRTDPACAMREGDWSLVGTREPKVPPGHGLRPDHVTYLKQAKLARFELYNLREDPAQKRNVADQYPELLAMMKKRMVALRREVVAAGPQWF